MPANTPSMNWKPGDKYIHPDFPEGTEVLVSESMPSVHENDPLRGKILKVTVGTIWTWGSYPEEQVKLVPVLYDGNIHYLKPEYLTQVRKKGGWSG